MKATTIVMFVASLWFLVIGCLVLFNKSVKDKMESSIRNASDKSGYLRFNGMFNLVIGVIGIIIAIADYFVKDSAKSTLIIFIVVMLASSLLQASLGKRYK